MSNQTESRLDDHIDRYARGELSAVEARALAQKSLDDEALFDDLTSAALTKAALAEPSLSTQLPSREPAARVVRFPRKARTWTAVAAAAVAAAVLIIISVPRFRHSVTPVTENSPGPVSVSSVAPGLASEAKPGQPILLATSLQRDEKSRDDVFRGPESDSRLPQPSGTIVSIEDGLASIDLGSLDGIVKDTELPIFRDQQSTQPIGRLRVSTVFRDRARGRILAERGIRVKDRVRVEDAAYLVALLDQVDALSSRGKSEEARTMAEKAVRIADTASASSPDGRKALERLAAMEYQAGSLEAAEKYYRSVVDGLNAQPAASPDEQVVALNNLGVLLLLRGNYDGAESPLSQAISKSQKRDGGYARTSNNLGVLAELRGDRRKAETFYNDALKVFDSASDSSPEDRRLVETNLARVRTTR